MEHVRGQTSRVENKGVAGTSGRKVDFFNPAGVEFFNPPAELPRVLGVARG
jgi:hypothetical protein